MKLVIYTLEFCPHCEQLKELLNKNGCAFSECRMDSAEGITELRVNNCFAIEAPVLQKGEDEFYTSEEMFPHGEINNEAILSIIKESL